MPEVMDDPQYNDCYVLGFYKPRDNTPFRRYLFDMRNDGERGEKKVEAHMRKTGIADVFKSADIDWQVAFGSLHLSGVMFRAEEPEQVEAIRKVTNDDVKLLTVHDIMRQKKKRTAQFREQKDREEMAKLPQDIINMQKRLKELEDKYTTRIWFK